MNAVRQYFMRFLDLVLTDALALRRHKLSRLVPDAWLDWASWYAGNRDLTVLSRSQCAQDLYCLFILEKHFGFDPYSDKGTFIEFGGFDGLQHSNSYSLEKLGWSGLVLEPDSGNFAKCQENRSCEVVHAAVVGNNGPDTVSFFKDQNDGELSHIAGYGTSRAQGAAATEEVKTTTLDALLARLGQVDILSMDTEGSEADIVENSNLPVSPRVIVVEHNYHKENRRRIRTRLEALGYVVIARSGNYFDDYFVRK